MESDTMEGSAVAALAPADYQEPMPRPRRAGRPVALPRKKRVPQERQTVPIGPTETLRTRLQLSKEHFGEAIGLNATTYSGYLRKGTITKTGALAAEALIRRQQASGELADEVFVLGVIEGNPTMTRINELRRMRLDDEEFYLVPGREAQTQHEADGVFVIRIIKGAPTAMRVNELQRMMLGNQDYYLIPAKDTRT